MAGHFLEREKKRERGDDDKEEETSSYIASEPNNKVLEMFILFLFFSVFL